MASTIEGFQVPVMSGGSDHCNSEPYNHTSSRYNDHQDSKNGSRSNVKWHASQATQETTSIPTPIPVEPSEAYLITSLKPSCRLFQSSPKLLVLDLNGTLLYRLPPPRYQLRSSYRVYSESSPAPSRTTYLRPYFPSFRRYLFHATTRAWLDVMVWSSAQPHSVKSMLQLCFPREEEDMEILSGEEGAQVKNVDDRFLAVWARDTLGLSRSDYARKTQTIKNLEKVWTDLATIPRSASGDAISESNSQSPTNNNFPFSHSSLSTLLLDDSPLKARLQPWNHFCIKEYDQAIWKEDTQSLSRHGKSKKKSAESIILEDTSVMKRTTHISDPPGLPVSELEDNNVEKIGLSAGPRETQIANNEIPYIQPHNSTQISLDSPSPISHNQTNGVRSYSPSAPIFPRALSPDPSTNPDTNTIPDTDSEPSPHLDETLLAVIGVLEELKYQSNVSSWFRNRGLWSKDVDDENIITAENQDSVTPPPSSSLYSNVMSLTSGDIQDMPIPGLSSTVPAPAPSPSASLKRCHQDAENGRRKSKRRKSSNGVATSSRDDADLPIAPLFWFEDKSVFAYWVGRGRQKLCELDIPEIHGLDTPIDGSGRGRGP